MRYGPRLLLAKIQIVRGFSLRINHLTRLTRAGYSKREVCFPESQKIKRKHPGIFRDFVLPLMAFEVGKICYYKRCEKEQ